ncbi:lipoate--protein ligase [Clostridium sp. WILCCON 0269]|uniref:lipoate--protein ligase n=1 Tax=Candidatus Clostridium eludens TaxID=3381663 RepID=A0ABW8SIQ4_9CLOT
MVEKLLFIKGIETYPYKNLALEEYLTFHVGEKECILYLWQNRHTVVIGRNQNCWKECKVKELENDEGYLVRRLSGGGAVYHDLGNLNFTFLMRKDNYSVDRQLQVIVQAVKKLGIHAEKTGRNDITVDGRKFSGNAFYKSGDFCYHHGTLLLDVDMANMSKYLNVSKEKLQSKSVSSVKSRVVNLKEFYPSLTTHKMCEKLIEAFGEVYGLKPEAFDESHIDKEEFFTLQRKFESWQWKYGKKLEFQHEMSGRFAWGDIDLQFQVHGGKIKSLNAFSDAMDQDLILRIPEILIGCTYEENAIKDALSKKLVHKPEDAAVAGDIEMLIHNNM